MTQGNTFWNGPLASNDPSAGTTMGGQSTFLVEPNGYVMPGSNPPNITVSPADTYWVLFWRLPNQTQVYGVTLSRLDNALFYIQQLATQQKITSYSVQWMDNDSISTLTNVTWQKVHANATLPQ